MMKPRRPQWPTPADTPVDRARAIARDLHARLARHDPDEAAAAARAATALGEPWLEPQRVTHTDDDWLTLEDAAAYTTGGPEMIRKWTRRGPNPLRYTTDSRGRILVRLGDVRDRQADQRKRRIDRAS
jgi:hypothetical protein